MVIVLGGQRRNSNSISKMSQGKKTVAFWKAKCVMSVFMGVLVTHSLLAEIQSYTHTVLHESFVLRSRCELGWLTASIEENKTKTQIFHVS